jgi:hypothetical protein
VIWFSMALRAAAQLAWLPLYAETQILIYVTL